MIAKAWNAVAGSIVATEEFFTYMGLKNIRVND